MDEGFRILLSPQAAADLEAIFAYLSKDSPINASALVERILEAIERLKTFPHRNVVARQSRKLKYPVRSTPVPPYVIFFRVLDDQRLVRVLHVRHGARRRLRRFR